MNKKIITIAIILLSFFNTSFASKNIINTENIIEKYWKEPFYFYQENKKVNVKLDWWWKIKYHVNRKSIDRNNNKIELPRLSWQVNYLYELIWKNNLIKLSKSGVLYIFWNTQKFWVFESYKAPFWAAEKYFEWEKNDIIEIENYLTIGNVDNINIYSDKNQKTKIVIEPFNNELLWTMFTSWVDSYENTRLTIFDDLELPNNLTVWVNYLGNTKKYENIKTKYKAQKYLVKNWKWNEYISVILMPYYEVEIDLREWSNDIRLTYTKYKRNSNPLYFYDYEIYE